MWVQDTPAKGPKGQKNVEKMEWGKHHLIYGRMGGSWSPGSDEWTGSLTRQHHWISKRLEKGCGINSILLREGKSEGHCHQWQSGVMTTVKKENAPILSSLFPQIQDVADHSINTVTLQLLVTSTLDPPPSYLIVRNQWCSHYQTTEKT